ncbi:MAG TPA: exodeoxyribonuclease III, partial [Anaerolineae bacterium]|nr:exodeoxyribonuclease III [Anaerolineae bacterium]
IGWRIDYFLVSAALMPQVRDVVIHDDVMGSDHCPVTLILDHPAAS